MIARWRHAKALRAAVVSEPIEAGDDVELAARIHEVETVKRSYAAGVVHLKCPWCSGVRQRGATLSALEVMPRVRLAGIAKSSGWGWYMACEACAWDIDGTDVPPMRVLH